MDPYRPVRSLQKRMSSAVFLWVVVAMLVPAGARADTPDLSSLVSNCKAGEASACEEASFRYTQLGEYREAYDLALKGCKGGIGKSCFRVGVIYLGFSVETREAARAAGVKLDAQEALSYFKRACEAQYARGCYYVGSQIVGLFPSKKERAEAFPWYAAACDLGDADGCEKAIEAAPVEKIEGLQHKACELGRKQYCPAPETLLQWRLLAGSRYKIHVERIKRIRMSQLKTMTEDMIMDLVLEIKTVDDVGNGHGLLRFDYLGRRISLGKSDKGLRERVPKERLATYELPCELSRAGLIRFDKNSANSLFPDYKDLASILYRVFPPLADRVVTVGTVWAFEVDDVTVRMKYARFDGENLVLEGGGTSEKPGRMPTGSDTSYSNADTIAAWFNPTDLCVTGVVWVDKELTKVGEQTSQQYEKISVRVKKQEAGTRPSEKD